MSFSYQRFLILITAILVCFSCSSPNKKEAQEEREEQWMSLFNGNDIDDWMVKIHHHEVGVNFANTFRVEDSILKVRYDGYDEFNDQFGHLYYKEPFSHYHIKFEYRFVGELQKGAPDYTLLNSGVMFHSQDPGTMLINQDWPISVEMQLLAGLGDGEPRPTGNMCSPGTDIVYEGEIYDGHCLNSSSKTYEKDRWVKGELIVLGDSLVTHVIEGDTVLQYSKPQMGGGVVNGYDSTFFVEGKRLTSGFIALQSEGQPIDFRNVKILRLKEF